MADEENPLERPPRITLHVGPTPGSSDSNLEEPNEPQHHRGPHSRNFSDSARPSDPGGSEPQHLPTSPRSPFGVKSAPSVASTGFSAIKADLTVELEHRVYYPGALLRGTVRLNVRKTTKFYALRLRICGKESMVIRKKKNAGDILTRQRETFWKQLYTLEGTTKTHAKHVAERDRIRTLAASRACVARSSVHKTHTCTPGEYVYPFEVQLPYDAPPSFEEFGDQEDYAAILYYAKAYLDIPGGGDSDLIGRTFFRVVSRVGVKQWKEEAKPVADHKRHKITGCCGMSKGFVKTSVEVPRCLISIADDHCVPYRVVVNNSDGTEPVNRVTVELEHLLHVHAGGEDEERRTTVASKVESKQILPGRTDGIIGKLPLPEDCLPSMRGILFSSVFTLRIECDVPFAVDPVTIVPMTVFHRAESKEPVPPVTYASHSYAKAQGLCEVAYRCPESREQHLSRMYLGGGGGHGTPSNAFGPMHASLRVGRSAMFDGCSSDDDADELETDVLTAPPIDYRHVAKRRPDARWQFAPPTDYS
uniref:Arrestin-like N-terminal domain-containing protein n=1 Tax=Neobodo designis TaxID=312471 RepID=A0A7S1QXT1_NEODS|mmetsp:Transcript_54318/g.167144  ORF Transcript_54318/g.167144 Transcript_54318/m.167144 type:complete len:533 (+) Transcript_54318:187-1785(+)